MAEDCGPWPPGPRHPSLRLYAATAVLFGVTDMAVLGVFALIGSNLKAGWKTHRLARAPHPRMVAGA